MVQAYLNGNIKFTVDGAAWTPKDSAGKKLSPLVYNGSTYLPAKAVGEALQAQVLWNANSKTVEISTSGGSVAGEPYNDAPSSSGSIASSTVQASPVTSAAPAAGVLTLADNFELNAASKQLKPVALAFAHAYGAALTSGSTKELDALIDKYTAKVVSNDYTGGIKISKDTVADYLAGDIKYMDSSTLAKYSSFLKNADLGDISVSSSSDKGVYNASLDFNVEVPGSLQKLEVNLFFDHLEDGTYVLGSLAVG